MRTRNTLRALLATAAIAAAAAVAAPASAAVTYTLYLTDQPLPVDQVMIIDFDAPIADGFTFTQDANAYVRDGSLGLDPGVSAPPPGDTTNYETVLGGGKATLTAVNALKSFSFYLGSPDTYNTVKFTGANGFSLTLSGDDIWGGGGGDNGNQGWGRRISYDFGADRVNKIEFTSTGNSFEFDSLAGAAVPEPATWAMMIMGFGAMGAVARRRRTALSLA